MDDAPEDFLGPPHGTTSAAVIANKMKLSSLRAVSILMRKRMDHTAVSATQASSMTLQIWQNGAKEKYCNFATFNRIVDTTRFLEWDFLSDRAIPLSLHTLTFLILYIILSSQIFKYIYTSLR